MTGGGTVPGAGRRGHDRWTASGLRGLTGRPDGPGLDPPPGLLAGLDALAAAIAGSSARLGRPVVVDPLEVLAGRSRASGLGRRGDVSCGGSARLVRAADGWLAVNLARPADRELVPAWLGLPGGQEGWGPVMAAMRERTVAGAVGDADGLGLPVAAVGERTPAADGEAGSVPGVRVRRSTAGPARALTDLVVVDLSALWAGPLVASLLGRGGAMVVKVESTDRPDGARQGDAAHYRSLNGGKASVVLDLTLAAGRHRLAGLVDRADVVVTASRPRALEHLGLDAGSARPDGAPRVWLSVTGYGSGPGSADRVAFGDDAAAAGGLVVWDGAGPCFCADAVADPAAGLAATAAVLAELERGGDAWLEASMADVAAGLTVGSEADAVADADAGPVRVAGTGWEPGPVRAPGADTAAVLADLGVP